MTKKYKDPTGSQLSREALAAKSLIDALNEGRSEGLDEDTTHDMIEGETGFFEAVEKALDEIRACEITQVGIKEMTDKLSKRATNAKNKAERLRGLIEQAMTMADIKSHSFPCETVSIKATPPKMIIVDESAIPSDYFVPQPPKLDRAKLTAAAKAHPVEGVEMSNGGQTIQIRRS